VGSIPASIHGGRAQTLYLWWYASPGAAADQPGVQDWYIPFKWLKRYKVSLVNLLDLKRHRGHRLCKSQRRTARRVAADFHSDPKIHSSLPELSPLLSLHVRDWTGLSWHSHMHKVQELHGVWKRTLDSELLETKKLKHAKTT
jgi:hypothetical protein